LSGLLGGNAARARAEQARQAAINQYATSVDSQFNNQVDANHRNLFSAAGTGADAIASLYGRQVAANAGNGVYNSTADLGYRTQLTNDQAANLANMASQNSYNANLVHDQGNRAVGQMRLGAANEDYQNATNNLNHSRQGFSSFLGSLGQYNLARTGSNQVQNAMPRSVGGYGNPGVLAPGAGGINPALSLNGVNYMPQSNPNSSDPFGFQKYSVGTGANNLNNYKIGKY
jgi:hypothetical protein